MARHRKSKRASNTRSKTFKFSERTKRKAEANGKPIAKDKLGGLDLTKKVDRQVAVTYINANTEKLVGDFTREMGENNVLNAKGEVLEVYENMFNALYQGANGQEDIESILAAMEQMTGLIELNRHPAVKAVAEKFNTQDGENFLVRSAEPAFTLEAARFFPANMSWEDIKANQEARTRVISKRNFRVAGSQIKGVQYSMGPSDPGVRTMALMVDPGQMEGRITDISSNDESSNQKFIESQLERLEHEADQNDTKTVRRQLSVIHEDIGPGRDAGEVNAVGMNPGAIAGFLFYPNKNETKSKFGKVPPAHVPTWDKAADPTFQEMANVVAQEEVVGNVYNASREAALNAAKEADENVSENVSEALAEDLALAEVKAVEGALDTTGEKKYLFRSVANFKSRKEKLSSTEKESYDALKATSEAAARQASRKAVEDAAPRDMPVFIMSHIRDNDGKEAGLRLHPLALLTPDISNTLQNMSEILGPDTADNNDSTTENNTGNDATADGTTANDATADGTTANDAVADGTTANDATTGSNNEKDNSNDI